MRAAESAEIIHNRMKKKLNRIIHDQREYAILKLQRRLNNIPLPPGFPEGMDKILEEMMASILETSNTSLMQYADTILTVVSEELAELSKGLTSDSD